MPVAPSDVLIAGAGDIGTRAAVRLMAGGLRVATLRRSAAENLGPMHTVIQADLTDPASLESLQGVTSTALVAVAPSERSVEAYEDVYRRGVANLVAAIGPTLERLVLVTSTAVYGYDDGRWVDESTPVQPSTPTAEVLVAAEVQAQNIGPSATTVVRLAGIYGPGRTRLIDNVRAGTATLGDRYTNRVHADDAAGLLAALALVDHPPAVVIGVDEAPVSQREVVGWLYEKLGFTAPHEQEASAGRSGNKRCVSVERQAIGYDLRYRTYREGYTAVLAEMTSERTEKQSDF